ncbi:MAG: U32 family peptidase [Clostridia bacterium]|nr:U32 family peptidase [Clostridia bacterium]
MAFLLSPAGNPECLVAGVQNGADEIYLGLTSFSARAGADNFSLENLGEWVSYAHVRGVKIHVALNTLLKDTELASAVEMAKEADRLGVDAFILQDVGLAGKLAGVVGAKLHASTQMTVMNLQGLKMAKALGFSRAVLARELSLPEIEELAGAGIMETEVFCHGALCMSYSGQCMLSFFTAGRSGNRGTCSQPCRLKYSYNNDKNSEKHLLSPADLAALPYLEKLTATGVTSLKIEGRLKSPEYVAAVTRAYRHALENPAADVTQDMKNLTVIFSRGGFCSGHQLGKLPKKDITLSYAGKTGLPCGEIRGKITQFRKNNTDLFTANVSLREPLAPGDGISFAASPEFGGTVNIIEKKGERTQLASPGDTARITVSGTVPKQLKEPLLICKTLDQRYLKELQKSFAKGAELRRVPVTARLSASAGLVTLTYSDGIDCAGSSVPFVQGAGAPEAALKEIISATGGTPFDVTSVDIDGDCGFLTFSSLKKLRREAVSALTAIREGRRPL